MSNHRVYSMSAASVYPLYISKAVKKGRTKVEMDEIVCWLTGYTQEELEEQLKNKQIMKDFHETIYS